MPDLNLCWADDRSVVSTRDVAEPNLRGPPAVMTKRSLKRWPAGDAADHSHLRGIVACLDANDRFIGLAANGARLDVLVQRFATATVDVAHRRTNLRVGIAVDIFHQEVEQPALALQHARKATAPR